MNILSILKKIGKGGLAAADAGAKVGIPVAEQIDGIADAVADIKGKRKIDDENIGNILGNLEKLRETHVEDVKDVPKTLLESNRFKATVLGALVSIGVYYGLPQEIASQTAEVIFYLVATYVLADTLRASKK